MGLPQEGDEISLGGLVGTPCYVMVKRAKGKKDPTKTFWNVVMVKGAKKAVTPVVLKKTATPVRNGNPGGVSSPEQIPENAVGTTPVTNKKKVFENTDF